MASGGMVTAAMVKNLNTKPKTSRKLTNLTKNTSTNPILGNMKIS